MKKFVNVRIPVLCACALIIGIGFALAIKYYNLSLLWLIAVTAVIAFPFIITALCKKSAKPFIFMAFALIFVICGAFNCFLRLSIYSNDDISNADSYFINGKIYDMGNFGNSRYIIINNIKLGERKINEKFFVYLNEEQYQNCGIGYAVSFNTKELNYQEPFKYGNLNYNVEKNIKYSCTASDNFTSEYRFSLFGSVRAAVHNILFENLDSDVAAVCYAMLVGDTGEIENTTIQSIRFGGIAHIFAVSGLHIGIIFGIISFICKKLRLNKYVTAGICIPLVFFYCGICGFTLSSVRAAIMCTVATIAKLILRKNDGLNSLAIAVILILTISPLSLTSVGFRLSVCAVGGIAVLSKNIERTLNKIKIPSKISSAAGISFGAQLGTLPIMLAEFGYISGAGLLLNIIILPLLSFLFVLLFLATFLCAALPFIASAVIPFSAAPLSAVISFLVNTGFEKALISGFGAGAFIPLYFLALLTLTDKLNYRRVIRLIGICGSVIVLTSFVLLQSFLPVNGFKICISAYNGGENVIIKSSQGTTLVITENVNPSKLKNSLNKFYSANIQSVIILGSETCVTAFGEAELNCRDAYVYILYVQAQPYSQTTVHYKQNFTISGVNYEYVDGYTLIADIGGIKTCISANANNKVESCDLLISKYDNISCIAKCEVFFGIRGRKFNIYDYGDISFIARNGDLSLNGILPNR